jgi:hypothetical protein
MILYIMSIQNILILLTVDRLLNISNIRSRYSEITKTLLVVTTEKTSAVNIDQNVADK